MSVTADRTYGPVWEAREAKFWLAHPHFCTACGRAIDPDAPIGAKHRAVVHHLTYRYDIGSEPDCVLVGMCAPCHTEDRGPIVWTELARARIRRHRGSSLHTMQRVVSLKHGWMKGQRIINPERHYRHLWSYSIRWIRFHRFWAHLIPGRHVPAWSAPNGRWR